MDEVTFFVGLLIVLTTAAAHTFVTYKQVFCYNKSWFQEGIQFWCDVLLHCDFWNLILKLLQKIRYEFSKDVLPVRNLLLLTKIMQKYEASAIQIQDTIIHWNQHCFASVI